MRLVVCRNIPEDLAPRWNALVERMERPEIFYTHEWALAASHAFQSSVTPLLLLAYQGTRLVGVAALATDSSQRKAFFLAGTTADYCDFVCGPDQGRQFLQLVFRELQRLRISMLVAANLPADSMTSATLKQAPPDYTYGLFSRPAYHCAQVVFRSAAERQAVKQSIATDKRLRYCLKNLRKQGALTVDHLKSWDDIRAALPHFVEMHVARFRSAGRSSNLADPERQAFLSELARLLSQRGQMVLTRLKVGDRPIAWNFGFQFAGKWFYYQPTFDVAWQRYSPGVCLLAKMVEAACDDPAINVVDLGLGAEGYKERFATNARQTLHVTLTNSAVRRFREAARYNAASLVKSSPFLEHCVRRVLGRVSRGAPA